MTIKIKLLKKYIKYISIEIEVDDDILIEYKKSWIRFLN